MITLSVQNSHNASICETNNNKIVYFQEAERLDGIKKSTNWTILLRKYTNTKIDKFIFVHSSSDYPTDKQHIENVLQQYNITYKKIEYKIDHHFYHACAAFFNSGLEQSYVFVYVLLNLLYIILPLLSLSSQLRYLELIYLKLCM